MNNQQANIKSIWSTFRSKGIGRRFAIYILLFSSIITLIITVIQLFNDYRQDVITINRTLQQIQIIYQDTLSTAIWVHNQTGMNLQLDGMMRLPSILYVQVDNELGEKLEHRGIYREQRTLKNSFELSYVHREKKISLGKVNVLADLDAVYNRLLNKLVIIFISQGLKTFLVSLFILLLFYLLVGRFLITMSKVAKKVSEGSYGDKLEIGRDDELSDVSDSFNEMTRKLVTNMEALEKEVNERCLAQQALEKEVNERCLAQQALEEHKKNLEDLVHEKTCDLINANKKLHSTNNELQEEISERKQAEESLRKSESKYKRLSENSPAVVYQFKMTPDGEFTFPYISDAVESIMGVAAQKVLQNPSEFLDMIHPEDQKIFLDGVLKSAKSLELYHAVIRYLRNGEERWVEARSTPDKVGDGSVIWDGFLVDITGKKKVEKERAVLETRLQQSQKMESIGTLAGGIAHDFNNILYPIIGFTELSMQELPKTHEVQENLQDILEGAKRARDLVKQILMFARQEKQTLKPTVLKPVVEEAMKLLRSSIPANIDIQCNLYDGKDFVLCDATEIHEIVMNLCTNAYHSMEESGGAIVVRLNKQNPLPDLNLPPGEYLCLSVSDNGVGIPIEIIDKIFEPYLTTKEIGKGSGLGLSVVHGIVTNYDGNISVESSPGKGTVFNVFLPVTTQSIQIEQKLVKDTPPGGTENILLVDDEASIVKLAKRILERLGYTITGKTSCTEALELFKEKPDKFDLVITDMAMPVMTGAEFAKKILKIQPDIPIIICTGFSERLDPEIAKSIGIKEYIKKPILTDELTSKIREVLDQSSKG